jgi:hypothetical protein
VTVTSERGFAETYRLTAKLEVGASLMLGKHRVAAQYIPTEGGVFLPSKSLDKSHSVVEK